MSHGCTSLLYRQTLKLASVSYKGTFLRYKWCALRCLSGTKEWVCEFLVIMVKLQPAIEIHWVSWRVIKLFWYKGKALYLNKGTIRAENIFFVMGNLITLTQYALITEWRVGDRKQDLTILEFTYSTRSMTASFFPFFQYNILEVFQLFCPTFTD